MIRQVQEDLKQKDQVIAVLEEQNKKIRLDLIDIKGTELAVKTDFLKQSEENQLRAD